MRITALSVLRVETSGSGQAKAKPDMRRRQRTPPHPAGSERRPPMVQEPTVPPAVRPTRDGQRRRSGHKVDVEVVATPLARP